MHEQQQESADSSGAMFEGEQSGPVFEFVTQTEEAPSVPVIETETVADSQTLATDTETPAEAPIDQDISNLEQTLNVPAVPEHRIHRHYPLDNIIGPVDEGVKTRSRTGKINICLYTGFLS